MSYPAWEETIEWARVVVGCIVYKDTKYLMVQEKQEWAYGLWNLPAGHVDKGELLEEAARREAKEETGYEVRLVHELGIYHHTAQSPVKHAYEAEIIGGSMHAQEEEILQVEWLSYKEIEKLYKSGKIRSEWIWQAINDHRRINKLGD